MWQIRRFLKTYPKKQTNFIDILANILVNCQNIENFQAVLGQPVSSKRLACAGAGDA